MDMNKNEDTPIQEIDKAISHIVGQIQKTSQSDIIANLCLSVEKLIELRIKMEMWWPLVIYSENDGSDGSPRSFCKLVGGGHKPV